MYSEQDQTILRKEAAAQQMKEGQIKAVEKIQMEINEDRMREARRVQNEKTETMLTNVNPNSNR